MPKPNQNRQTDRWELREAGAPRPASEEGVPELPREPRLKGVNRWPLLLRPVDVESRMEPGRPVRAIWGVGGAEGSEPLSGTHRGGGGNGGAARLGPSELIRGGFTPPATASVQRAKWSGAAVIFRLPGADVWKW